MIIKFKHNIYKQPPYNQFLLLFKNPKSFSNTFFSYDPFQNLHKRTYLGSLFIESFVWIFLYIAIHFLKSLFAPNQTTS